jgi:hypothetical protein
MKILGIFIEIVLKMEFLYQYDILRGIGLYHKDICGRTVVGLVYCS